ncbi:MAG: B12-binding domain-containing radical SAM protein [Ignavibacteria bacterium]|nr:B12-binding domain-containing radical SAM protein [Ignavibacteria bacterium]
MNRILFTNSYFLRQDPKEYKNMNLYAPLGTLYAASYLRSKGYITELFDTMLAESEKDIEEKIKEYRPDVLVIYDDVFNYLTKMCLTRMREAALNMTRIAKKYSSTVIISGSDSADHLDKYFSGGADYVIVGEGEVTLGELADYLNGKSEKKLNEIEGIAYVRKEEIIRNSPRKVLRDLDCLPFPAWDLVDFNSYRWLWKKHHGYFSMNLVTTRGCPFHCNWCAKPIYGQVYNSHSPSYVVGMMKYIAYKYQPDHIWFCDDIFGLKPGWIKEFRELLEKENIKIPFKCLSRADLLLKEENIKDLSLSGCESIWIGAESGSQKILDAMEKGTTIEEIYKSTDLLRKNNIKVSFFIQFGYSGETISEIRETEKMIYDLMPEDIGISVSYPLPGTRFYERVVSQMKHKHNWELSDDFEMMFDGEYSTKFYRILHRKVHNAFRMKQLLNEPIRRFSKLWKLPFYFSLWLWNLILFSLQLRQESKSPPVFKVKPV